MLNLDGEKIEAAICELTGCLGSNKTKLRDLEKEKARIAEAEKRISSLISGQESKVKILRNALLVLRGVPSDVARVRGAIIDCMRESQRKDIYISRKEELETQIKEFKKQLQKLCKHPFVIGRVSYESHEMYESSWVLGYRLCVVCGYGETTSGWVYNDDLWHREEGFPTLNENAERVIDKYGLNSSSGSPLDIWQPLEEVLKLFVDKRIYEMVKT